MNDLNDLNDLTAKLAELCGMELMDVKPPFTMSGLKQCYKMPDGSMLAIPSWNPTADLNQLKMCYEAAEKGWDRHDEGSFQAEFEDRLRFLVEYQFVGETEHEYQRLVATAIFKNPELVAQAILKAKEVTE